MRDFVGRVGVVTGAARGIGFALAQSMATRGMRVVLSDVEAARPHHAANMLRAEGADVLGVVCDVTDPVQVDELAAKSVERFGRVDLLCNNAGIVSGGVTWEIPLETWKQTLGVNLWGVIHGVRSFVPILLGNPEGGHVVNVASMAAVTPVPGIAPYNVSKHGVLALSETLRADLQRAGAAIGVTVVMPGRVATGIGLASGEPVPYTDDDLEPGLLSAGEVADQIMTAVSDGTVYLFTHPERMQDVKDRFAAIVGADRSE